MDSYNFNMTSKNYLNSKTRSKMQFGQILKKCYETSNMSTICF